MASPHRPAALARVNPLVKLAAAVAYIFFVTFLTDLALQALMLLATIAVLLLWTQISPRQLLITLLPFALIGFGYFWTVVFFYAGSGAYAQSLLGPSFEGAALAQGLVLFARSLCFGAISTAFVVSTNPADLMRSLMQHARLPPYIAFSIFSAVQFLPELERDLARIRMAHAMRRGRGGRPGRASLLTFPRYALPLLASTIRRSGRAAISMEARGLSRSITRTSLHASVFGWPDVVFLAAAGALLAGLMAAAALR